MSNYPKIGIRPVIDGRWGGVRESLENQTMNMARAAAELISANLRYTDGTPAKCVIGCTTIGGGAEAAKVAEQFASENVVATLSVTPCWCYGSETMDLDPKTIKAVWGFNGTERPARYTLPPLWQRMLSADCLLSRFTDTTYRMRPIRPSRRMLQKKFFALPVLLLLSDR